MYHGYKVGLALSGGGAKGIAHLGVLKALEERGIEIDYISGVSAGAIMGALYADGNTPEDICQFIKKSDLYSMVSLTMPTKGGLTKMNSFHSFIEKKLKAKTFEELRIPLVVNATELNSGKNVYFDHGKLIDCIIASASVPIFFRPTKIGKKEYVDGGIFCNLPAKILRRRGCGIVIGVHVNPITPEEKYEGILDVSERVFHLAVNGNTVDEKKDCNIVIETKEAQKYGMFDASKAEEILQVGYDEAVRVLDQVDWDEVKTNVRISAGFSPFLQK